MTTLTDPPKESFRLSMLIYDTRYRSTTFQIIALIGFLTLIGWLISNTAQNLSDLGKEPSFGFLKEPAGYDINQRLIEYTNRSPHMRAALAGLMNTLLVAVMGCALATVLGVVIGVLRLSKNWLIAKIMTVYVEMFRNVPVLLWIVLFMAVLIETLSPPGAFKSGEASFSLWGTVAISNQGIFIPRATFADHSWLFIAGIVASIAGFRYIGKRAAAIQEATGEIKNTLPAKLAALILPSLLIFLVLSAVSNRNEQSFVAISQDSVTSLAELQDANGRIDYCHSGGLARSLTGLRYLTENEVNFRRKNYFGEGQALTSMTAARCQLILVPSDEAESIAASIQSSVVKNNVVSVFDSGLTEGKAIEVEVPYIAPKGIPRFEGGTHMSNSLIALWLALSLYTAAFIAEIVRAGIMAISKGQTEAAGALGLRPGRIMRLVVLPQALRVIIPPLISNYLNLTKNSSLAIAVGYMDITGTLGGITLNQTGRELEALLLLMLIYLIISLSISLIMNWYNERVKLVER
ncbi:amino acid ABC transporter permease [Roseovarius sp. EL26]|uniref:amino acid ABC transporter permease n=1 Tax=Roseovarius sp. EL26 TaxID=2126672 RepID=UPI000EA0671D|nr:ABC transporter permease subunit [Roseovarius sp. EL26]